MSNRKSVRRNSISTESVNWNYLKRKHSLFVAERGGEVPVISLDVMSLLLPSRCTSCNAMSRDRSPLVVLCPLMCRPSIPLMACYSFSWHIMSRHAMTCRVRCSVYLYLISLTKCIEPHIPIIVPPPNPSVPKPRHPDPPCHVRQSCPILQSLPEALLAARTLRCAAVGPVASPPRAPPHALHFHPKANGLHELQELCWKAILREGYNQQ